MLKVAEKWGEIDLWFSTVVKRWKNLSDFSNHFSDFSC